MLTSIACAATIWLQILYCRCEDFLFHNNILFTSIAFGALTTVVCYAVWVGIPLLWLLCCLGWYSIALTSMQSHGQRIELLMSCIIVVVSYGADLKIHSSSSNDSVTEEKHNNHAEIEPFIKKWVNLRLGSDFVFQCCVFCYSHQLHYLVATNWCALAF